jgi:hypothetical protein
MKRKQHCVYTALLGNYEKLNEQPVAKESSIDFICFTNDKDLISSTWKIIQVDPIFPLDFIRSAKTIKICPHRFLPNFDTSLYIDNSVTLKVVPEQIFEDLMDEDYDIVCMKHSFRETVLDEFEEILRLQYDNQNIILEQLNAYSLINPKIFSQKPYWGGFLIRKHNKNIVIDAMEDWLAQVMRYSRRDQLSLNYIINKYLLNIKELTLDNYSTIYHQWPTSSRYGQPSIKLDLISSIENNIRTISLESKLKLLSAQIVERDSTIQSLTAQLFQANSEISRYLLSKSWRITRPMRKLARLLRGK